MAYDAFISYSHVNDSLAAALQAGLRTLAKPWYRLRALQVFRDTTDLSATRSLSGSIEQALRDARYFVYVASPAAARSEWVGREIAMWRTLGREQQLLIALAQGDLVWDGATQDFNWEHSTAVHPALKGVHASEPLWIDLRWAGREEHWSLRDPRFQRAVAKLAAPMHGISLDALIGEDVRQHRRTRRWLTGAVATLSLLLVLALSAAYIAWRVSRNLLQEIELTTALLPVFGSAREAHEEIFTTLEDASVMRQWATLVWSPVSAERLEWSDEIPAIVDACFNGESRIPDELRKGCPVSPEAFGADGFTPAIPGLAAMAAELAATLVDGRLFAQLGGADLERLDPTANPPGTAERLRDEITGQVDEIIHSARAVIPGWRNFVEGSLQWELREDQGYDVWRMSVRHWRTSLPGAELIALHLHNPLACGSGGCWNPTLFFLRVADRYRLVHADVQSDRFILYRTDLGTMPQIFSIDLTQSGWSSQRRQFVRLDWDSECQCYREYMWGEVSAGAPSNYDSRIPPALR